MVLCDVLLGVIQIYAIVKTGGKQYKVFPGQVLEVEHLNAEENSPIELDRVLLLVDGTDVTVGKPNVAGAKVRATVLGEGKGKKIIVFKYKHKVRYRRKTGHRQPFTRLEINEIVAG